MTGEALILYLLYLSTSMMAVIISFWASFWIAVPTCAAIILMTHILEQDLDR